MRNYTIDTLEKLCHYETTANDAFKLLYKLASSENELTTDALVSFIDLFQVALAETVLSLNKRVAILKEIEDQNGLSELLIQAYERMLKSHAFIGHIRSSNETFKRNYYYPNDPKEIEDYFIISINKLKGIAIADLDVLSDKAKNSLINKLSDQLFYGESQLVLEAITTIVDKEKKLDISLRNRLLELSSNKRDLSIEIIQLIDKILQDYQPETIEEELKSIVIESPWINQKNDETGLYINVSEEKAKSLAQKYIDKNIDWLIHLKLLLQGEQRHTFYFAEALSELGFNNEIIINQIIEIYKSIPIEKQNSIFVNGFISGSKNNDITRYFISKLILQPVTEVHGIRLIRYLKPITIADFNAVKPLLEKNPDYLRNLEYLDLTVFSNAELIEVTSWIKEINYSFALEIFYGVLRKEKRWEDLKEIVNTYLYTDNILQSKSFINLGLHVEDLFKKSINENPTKNNIEFLIHQIIKSYDDFNYGNDSLLDNLTYFLIEEHWDESWYLFGEYLIDENVWNYGLSAFLDRYKFYNEKLFEWSKLNPLKYPAIAFRFMNIYVTTEKGDLSWDPFARKIIDVFGEQKKVLEILSSKLSNYSINTYSAESLYIKRKRFLEELINHPFDDVKIFVKNKIEDLEIRIKEERKSGENYELGL